MGSPVQTSWAFVLVGRSPGAIAGKFPKSGGEAFRGRVEGEGSAGPNCKEEGTSGPGGGCPSLYGSI